jgi:tRNA 2-thiouridine synthesizing protein B
MLHTVNKSPAERTALSCCLRYARKGDSILLYEDGVYAARKAFAAAAGLEGAKDFKLFVLGPDLEARGIAAEQVLDGIEIVDYGGFVDLVAEVGPVQAWL